MGQLFAEKKREPGGRCNNQWRNGEKKNSTRSSPDKKKGGGNAVKKRKKEKKKAITGPAETPREVREKEGPETIPLHVIGGMGNVKTKPNNIIDIFSIKRLRACPNFAVRIRNKPGLYINGYGKRLGFR